MKQKKTLIIAIAVILALTASIGAVVLNKKEVVAPAKVSEPATTESVNEAPRFNAKQYSVDEPGSAWVVVNKQRPLPGTYAPANLVTVGGGKQMQANAAEALQKLLAAAEANNMPLQPLSAYRSFADQQRVYNAYVARDGAAKADTYSARPGHSEHQTGLAIDLGNGRCDLETCFGTTSAGIWLAANAHNYGFIIRYAEDKTAITGYQYEPWHIRYVGTDLARELFASKQTMEEFFNLPAAPSY